MRSKRLFRTCLLITLAILVPLLLEPLAHASTYVGYTASNNNSPCNGTPTACGGTTSSLGAIGQTVQAPLSGFLVAGSFYIASQSLPNQVVIATFPAGTTPTSSSCGGGACGASVNDGNVFTVQDVEGLSGLSTNTFTVVNLANPVSVVAGQWIAVMVSLTTAGTELQTCNTGCVSTFLNTCVAMGAATPNVGSTVTETAANCTVPSGVIGFIAGGTFNPTIASSGQTVAVTQCYGNCGNPPITLANTNSTHTVNFNQSITLLYQFQSNVNGFLLNVTTSMAKSYVTLPNGPAFGIYTIQSCPSGQTPFSPQCPGLLQQQSGAQSFFSPPKGKISFSGLHVPIANGQWVGIALSASFSGLDVNDTNTNVQLFQTNEGKIPPVIQAASSLGNSKVGLWAWINGNVVTGSPPTSPPGGACGPGLDSILTCVINSSCTLVTTQCQTGASIFWIIILTVMTIATLLGIFSYWFPNMNLSTRGMGEFAIVVFIGWFLAFASFNLLVPFATLLLIFVVAWLFTGRLRGTGPI
jgi:hypothetical protein